MSTNTAPATFVDILVELLQALFDVFLVLLAISALIALIGTTAGVTVEVIDRVRNPKKYRVGRITEYAKKLYPEYTAIEVKTKRDYNDMDDDFDRWSCSAAVCGTKDGVQSQLMIVERWSPDTLLSHLEHKIKKALRRKEAGSELEAEYEWRVAASAV
ncbi:hypothetical protein EKO04_009035 [Ascochyta lentis]|uniref:Uncharacterized protein n=1 Tax=Ascochyta lentis TaxID=205686 RepID=A0A8H7IY84_9PLEO|nr:hypothetical protein EKO04_009035 [Ascochyta lentis]